MQEANAPEISSMPRCLFFNIIPFLRILNFYLTFLTLAECSDDISLSSSQGHKGVILGTVNLGPMCG